MTSEPEHPEARRAIRPHGGQVALAVLAVSMTLAGLAGIPGQKQKAPKPGAGVTKPTLRKRVPRSLFVWDGSVATTQAGRDALIDFALERGIAQLFVDASAVGYSLPGAALDHAALVADAHSAGLSVVAAGGFPWWGVSDDAGLPGQPTGHNEGWDYYSAIAASGVPYDGVLDDTEPYLADPDDWAARTAERAQDYLDFLHGVRDRIGALPLYATIPFWYDEDPAYDLVLDGNQPSAPLNEYVAAIADTVVVMDYRDFARGTDGIIEHALGELTAGPTIIAVETTLLGTDPISDKLSFWEEGEAHMENELALVIRDLRKEPNLVGFAIHDEASYRLLGP